MKLSLFLVSILFSSISFAQLQLFQGDDSIENGDTIYQIHYGPDMIVEMYTHINVKNNGSATQQVVVRCDRTDLYPGAEVAVCWAGNCYGAYLYQSNHIAAITAGSINTTFEGRYYLNEHPNASSFVTFSFIDPAQPNDSTWVVCKYGQYYSELSLEELKSEQPFTISNNEIKMNSEYELVSIVNIMGGNMIETEDVTLSEGIYFLVVEGKNRRMRYKVFLGN